MMKWILVFAASIASVAAQAQNTMNLDLGLSDLLAPELTWSTSPPNTASCNASGGWTGAKGSSGSEVVPPIRASVIYLLVCDFPGETFATLSWINPTENTDGTPFTDPAGTRLIWSNQDNLSAFDCLSPSTLPNGVSTTDRPAGQTVHTVMGLTPGNWIFGAFAFNSIGLCSVMSNTAGKTITGSVQISDSISIGVPNSVTGLGAN